MADFPAFADTDASLFPMNITLEEARASVAGRIDFRETPAYDYVSFIYFLGMAPDIFPDPGTAPDAATKRLWQIRRECRGIIFHKDGHILSRRFQKFFNIGELPETNIDKILVKQPFVLLEKLDGSMIAPFFVEGVLRYCTKSGYTDSSKIVEDFVTRHAEIPYTAFCTEAIQKGYTPIFEWCSPAGRIVLEYKEEALSLLALRHMVTGNYVPFDQVQKLAEARGVPMVRKWALSELNESLTKTEGELQADLQGEPLKSLHSIIQAQQGVEGFVLQQDNGVMYKIKTKWYFSFHHSTQFLKYYGEKHIWEAILKGTLDDVKAWLPATVRDAIDKFTAELMKRAEACALSTFKIVDEGFKKHPARADFNQHVISTIQEPALKTLVWKCYAYLGDTTKKEPLSSQVVFEWILEQMLVNSSSPKALKKNSGFVGDLTYETYRPKNEIAHVFADAEE